MRKIVFTFMLILIEILPLWATNREELVDSVTFLQAQEAFDAENYSKAIEFYEALNEQAIRREKRINGTVIESLSSYYSMDELAIEGAKQRVRLLQILIYLTLFLLVAGAFCWLLLRWSKQRMERYNERLQEATDREQESMRGKSLLLANMSHEIRTPLNALSGFSEVLALDDIDGETQSQCNEIIKLNSELLLKLINDVIDLSSLNVGQMKFNLEPRDGIVLCQKVVKTINQVKTTHVPILLELAVNELPLYTDATRFQQVLINLLMNANKFTKEGEIVLKVELISPTLAQFSVTDTGCGILPEHSQQIFSRFEKLDEKAQGSGLGLSICQIIVKRLGGTIWLDTTYNRGARFLFTHPLYHENK